MDRSVFVLMLLVGKQEGHPGKTQKNPLQQSQKFPLGTQPKLDLKLAAAEALKK